VASQAWKNDFCCGNAAFDEAYQIFCRFPKTQSNFTSSLGQGWATPGTCAELDTGALLSGT